MFDTRPQLYLQFLGWCRTLSQNLAHSFLLDPIEIYEIMEYWFPVISELLVQQSKVEDLLNCVAPFLKHYLLFSSDFFCLSAQSFQNYIARMTYQANRAIITATFQVSLPLERDDKWLCPCKRPSSWFPHSIT